MKKLLITLALVATAACGTRFTGPKGPNAQTSGAPTPPNCSISTSPGVKCP